MTAPEVLASALLELGERGRATPCHGADEWTSDHAEDRALAARWCDGCPVLVECAAAADEHDERFGVSAGADRTPPPNRRRTARGPPAATTTYHRLSAPPTAT